MDTTSPLQAASSATDRIREMVGHKRSYSPRQEQILDVLEELFVTKGFRAWTVDELVAAAQCSRKTLYELAPSKGQLFVLVLDRMWRRLGEQARAAIAQEGTADAQIAGFVRNGFSVFKFPWGAVFEDIESYAPARRLHHDHIDVGIDFLANLIHAGIDHGDFRPVNPRVAAETLAAGMIHLTQQAVLNRIGAPAEQVIGELTEIVLAGLKPPGPARRPSRARPGTR